MFISDTLHTELRLVALEDDLTPRLWPCHGQVRVINHRAETVLACDHVYLVAQLIALTSFEARIVGYGARLHSD